MPPGQEDAHISELELDLKSKTALFSIFDGHGGKAVAKFSARHLVRRPRPRRLPVHAAAPAGPRLPLLVGLRQMLLLSRRNCQPAPLLPAAAARSPRSCCTQPPISAATCAPP